jgi:hypothetical protein
MTAMRLRALYNEANWAEEQMAGISYLFFLRRLLEEIEQDWPTVLAKLEHVRRTLVNRNTMLCNVTMEDAHWSKFAPQLEDFLAGLPAGSSSLAQWSPAYGEGFEGLTIPAQVNYVGKGANLHQLGYSPNGSAGVVTKFLGTTWIWEQVRMMGGAYGGFCTFDRLSGILTFLSYRDPNLRRTLDVYDGTAQFLREASLDETAVTRSIIGTIGDIDTYLLPDAKGYTSMVQYLVNDTDEVRQQRRDEVLATTAADFRAFADALDAVREQGKVIVIGSGDAIDKANAEFEQAGRPTLHKIDVL